MPRIIVKNAKVDERQVTGRDGTYIARSQMACLDLNNGYELPFRVGLGRNTPAYQPGEYDIDPKSYVIGKYGDLELGRYVDLISFQHKPSPAKA